MTVRASVAAEAGFTLVELVTTLVLVGILSVLLLPRFFSTQPFQARGFTEAVKSAIAYGRKFAIQSGCDTLIQVGNSTVASAQPGYAVSQWNQCRPASNDPSSGAPTPVLDAAGESVADDAPADVSVAGTLFYFDRVGRPFTATASPIPISNPAQLQVVIDGTVIQVEPETGFVREN